LIIAWPINVDTEFKKFLHKNKRILRIFEMSCHRKVAGLSTSVEALMAIANRNEKLVYPFYSIGHYIICCGIPKF
jgi:hypothetical protein